MNMCGILLFECSLTLTREECCVDLRNLPFLIKATFMLQLNCKKNLCIGLILVYMYGDRALNDFFFVLFTFGSMTLEIKYRYCIFFFHLADSLFISLDINILNLNLICC